MTDTAENDAPTCRVCYAKTLKRGEATRADIEARRFAS